VPELKHVLATAYRFGLVGIACAFLNVTIVYLGHDVFKFPYILAAAATCFITIPLSYLLHRSFSFEQVSAASWCEFARFVTQQLSQFCLGLLLLMGIVECLDLPPVFAMVIVSGLMFLYGFITNSTWVFKVFSKKKTVDQPPYSNQTNQK